MVKVDDVPNSPLIVSFPLIVPYRRETSLSVDIIASSVSLIIIIIIIMPG